jgi:spore photoproduct lyase
MAAAGCPYECSYCFLQATPSYVFGSYPLEGAIFANSGEMVAAVEKWLEWATPRALLVGELQDGMAFERAYRAISGRSLTEMLVPLFASQRLHRLIFLTKSTEIEYVRPMRVTDRVVFAWSVNAGDVSAKWERGAPAPELRLAAARDLGRRGWAVRIRIDPMVPHDGWQASYGSLCSAVAALSPETVTLGTLRASNTLRAHASRRGRDASIFDLLTDKDDAGYKRRLPRASQMELYQLAVDALGGCGARIALCKEHGILWQSLGLTFEGCNCSLVGAELPAQQPGPCSA